MKVYYSIKNNILHKVFVEIIQEGNFYLGAQMATNGFLFENNNYDIKGYVLGKNNYYILEDLIFQLDEF